MKLVKTSFFSAIITFIRIASGFVAGKVVALFVGPSGVALIGQFNNFITIALTFANGAINTGVVKYSAEFEDDNSKLKGLLSTSLKISIYCSAIFGIILFVGAPFFSKWLFRSETFIGPFRVLACTIILYSLNSLLISILNGLKQISTYTIVNAVGSLVGLVITVVLVINYKIKGALYALVLAQSIVFFVTMILIIKSDWFKWSFFNQKFDKGIALKLARFSLMTMVTAITSPLSQIMLRNMIVDRLGINSAGYWQGVMRISDGYLMLMTTSLATYYLPKLASIKNDSELRKEIIDGYKIIVPVILGSCVIIFLLRNFIIYLLYTPSFQEMEKLFLWQLIGDFFKIIAYLLAYVMLAKAMTKIYIITEILFSASYVALGYVCVKILKIEGITLAFGINYFLYFIVMVIIFRKLLLKK